MSEGACAWRERDVFDFSVVISVSKKERDRNRLACVWLDSEE